jgi:hypothetical protein
VLGQLALEPTTDLVELDVEAAGDELVRPPPDHGDDPREGDEGLERQVAGEPESICHHVRDGVVVVERDLDQPHGPDAARLCCEQQGELVGRESEKDS